jgi:LPS-assembly lipoprotein
MSSPEKVGPEKVGPEKVGSEKVGSYRPSASRLAHPTGRAVCTAVALGLAALGLGACAGDGGGLKPLYGATGGQTYDQRLARVDIAPVPGRVGQRIRNELVFERSTGNQSTGSDLRLDIVLTESVLTTLVSATGTSSSQVYQLEARYQLVDTKTKKSVLDGRSLGRGSFDRFASIYSNIRGREDAENRVSKSIAEDIRTRLLAYLSRES